MSRSQVQSFSGVGTSGGPVRPAWLRFGTRNVTEAKGLAQIVLLAPGFFLTYLFLIDVYLYFTLDPQDWEPQVPFGLYASVPVSCFVMAAAVRWLPNKFSVPLMNLLPVVGAATVGISNSLTDDASPGAQIFFLLPVLFACYAWHMGSAIVVIVVAVASNLLNVVVVLPPDVAFLDFSSMSVVMIVVGAAIIHARNLHDRMQEELSIQAVTDHITGLPTRQVLDDAIHAATTNTDLEEGAALFVIDIDYFKAVNDSYGHPAGDEALAHIASVLQQNARAGDMVSRIGGDELAVLLLNCSANAAKRRASELLQNVVSDPLTLHDGRVLPLSISIGVAHTPEHAQDVESLYQTADRALYVAKRNGRGRVALPPTRAGDPPVPQPRSETTMESSPQQTSGQ